MSRVDRTDQLLEILRQELIEKISGRQPDRPAQTATAKDRQDAVRPSSVGKLQEQLARELKTYDLSTSQGKHQARVAFIEAVVAWDLGMGLLRDPQFGLVIRTVEEAISQDTSAVKKFDGLLANLVAQ